MGRVVTKTRIDRQTTPNEEKSQDTVVALTKLQDSAKPFRGLYVY